jgi:hypothetical protein
MNSDHCKVLLRDLDVKWGMIAEITKSTITWNEGKGLARALSQKI